MPPKQTVPGAFADSPTRATHPTTTVIHKKMPSLFIVLMTLPFLYMFMFNIGTIAVTIGWVLCIIIHVVQKHNQQAVNTVRGLGSFPMRAAIYTITTGAMGCVRDIVNAELASLDVVEEVVEEPAEEARVGARARAARG